MGREDSGEALLRLVIFNRRPILSAAGKPASEKGQPGETPKNSANGQKTFKIHGSRNFYPPINSSPHYYLEFEHGFHHQPRPPLGL
jgi:hypothetical protein